MAKIIVQDTEITILSHNDKDYISLTDMANGKQDESRAADVIKNWIRTRYTIEFLGTWEMFVYSLAHDVRHRQGLAVYLSSQHFRLLNVMQAVSLRHRIVNTMFHFGYKY